MKTLTELVTEKRWPDDPVGLPCQWNRGEGLWELCLDVFGQKDPSQYHIADVGVARGISAQIFAHFGMVLAVDREFWPEIDALREHPWISWMQMDSLDAANSLRGKMAFDLVFLDTAHEEEWVTKEIEAWLPLVKKGGVIAGHDFSIQFPGVQWAVAKKLDGPDRVYSDSSWMKRIH